MQRQQLIASAKLYMQKIKDCSLTQQIDGKALPKFTFDKICENRRRWHHKNEVKQSLQNSSIIDLLEGVMETEEDQNRKMSPCDSNHSLQKMLARESGVIRQFFFLKDHHFEHWQQLLLCFRESLRHFAKTKDYFQKISDDMFLLCSDGNTCVNRRPQSVYELKRNGKKIYSQSESLRVVARLFEDWSLKHFPRNCLFQDIKFCSNFKFAVNYIDQFSRSNKIVLPSKVQMPIKIQVVMNSQVASLNFSAKKPRRQPRKLLNQTLDSKNYLRNICSSKTVCSTLNQSSRSSLNSSVKSLNSNLNKIGPVGNQLRCGSSFDLNEMADSTPKGSELKAADEQTLIEPPSCLEDLNEKMFQSITIQNVEIPMRQSDGQTSLLDSKLRGNIVKSIMEFDDMIF